MAPYERSKTSRVLTMTHAADLEADMPGDCHVVITLPAKPEYVALGRLAVAALGGWAELQADVVADLKVAVTEACAVLLARSAGSSGGAEPAALELSFDLCEERWVVVVAARGMRVSEASLSGVEARHQAGPESEDLGPAVIRALVDDVEFGGAQHPSGLRFTKTVR